MKYVINADDFGGYENVNDKIISLLRNKHISQTTIMVTCGETTKSAVLLAKQEGLENKIGLHVSLTHGHPLSESIKSTPFSSSNWLLNSYLSNKIHYFFIPRKIKKAIKEEINKQMAVFNAFDFKLKHFDSHGNIHFYPSFYKLFIECGLNNGFTSVRLPYCNKTKNPFLNFFKKRIIKAYKKNFDTVNTGTITLDEALNLADSHQSFEIMTHPKNDTILDDEKILKCFEKFGPPVTYCELNK